ncbi:MAG: hypothetical protein B5M51_00055 [Anaerolinea sp. 4484_236]|nr:MAG: hypothetical protein B5M51_00055 [Anaerolinea sp. 4484_236]
MVIFVGNILFLLRYFLATLFKYINIIHKTKEMSSTSSRFSMFVLIFLICMLIFLVFLAISLKKGYPHA